MNKMSPRSRADVAPDTRARMAAFDDEPAPRESDVWTHGMAAVPRDGSLVALLAADGSTRQARWVRWREMHGGRWRLTEGWRGDATRENLAKAGFEPVGWARYDIFIGPVKAGEV